MLQFRGIDLDFDIYDADQAEVYEEALRRVQEKSSKAAPNEGLAAGIRRQCGAVFGFFDDLFGEGFHKEIFGDRVNLDTCLEAFKEFTGLVDGQKSTLQEKYGMGAAAPNRATRRAAARKVGAGNQ